MAAHEGVPQRVNSSETQTLILGELATAEESDAYVIPGNAGQKLGIELLVPEGAANFAPTLVLFWRQLLDNELKGRRFVVNESAEPTLFADPDTGARLWRLFNVSAELNVEGTYGLVVESLENQTGRYALAFGSVDPKLDFAQQGQERAKLDEWLGKPPGVNPLLYLAAALIVVGVAVLGLVVWQLRRPKHVWQRKPWKR